MRMRDSCCNNHVRYAKMTSFFLEPTLCLCAAVAFMTWYTHGLASQKEWARRLEYQIGLTKGFIYLYLVFVQSHFPSPSFFLNATFFQLFQARCHFPNPISHFPIPISRSHCLVLSHFPFPISESYFLALSHFPCPISQSCRARHEHSGLPALLPLALSSLKYHNS